MRNRSTKPPASLTVHPIVNGKNYDYVIPHPLYRLLDLVRHNGHLTGAKEGCGEGECGACALLLNGKLVNSCLIPALQADACEVITPEGLAKIKEGQILAECFAEAHAVQCGFCTPGMMIACVSLLRSNPHPDEEAIRQALSGNICRCTGYDMIIDAVLMAAERGEGLW